MQLRELNPLAGLEEDPEEWNKLHEKVIQSANEIIALKGYTSWAIGLSIANLVNSILKNTGVIHPISVYVKVSKVKSVLISM